jgi:hypothetical protein
MGVAGLMHQVDAVLRLVVEPPHRRDRRTPPEQAAQPRPESHA